MRTLRAFFLSRLLREKLLLVTISVLVAVTLLMSFSKRAGAFGRRQRATTVALTEQQQWLQNRQAIERGAEAAVHNLDPARTLDDTRLVGELNELARSQGLRSTNDTPQTVRSGQFAMHTVQFNLLKCDWEALKRFYLELTKRSPYIGIEQFSLQAERTNPAQLNASLRVSSIEVVR
jgi:hypothetical protein